MTYEPSNALVIPLIATTRGEAKRKPTCGKVNSTYKMDTIELDTYRASSRKPVMH